MDYATKGQHVVHLPTDRIGVVVNIRSRRAGKSPGVAIVRFEVLGAAEPIDMSTLREATLAETRRMLQALPVRAAKSSASAAAS